MKKIFTLTLFLTLVTIVIAQEIEQISYGADYSDQVFYNLKDGDQTSYGINEWDLYFDISGRGVSIGFNEGAASGSVGLELYVAGEDFASVDTSTMTRIYNSETSWGDGAFNTVADTSNVLDSGWGIYDFTTHTVNASRAFVILLRDGLYKKIEIQSLASGVYTFRHANLDGTEEVMERIIKADYNGKNLAFYSFTDGVIDLEPAAWDLLYTRYYTVLDDGQGGIVDYLVTGILSGGGTEVAKVTAVDPTTVSATDYADAYTTEIDAIGYDWKSFDLNSFQWSIPSDHVYFVKTKDEELWKLQYLDFEGSSTGVTTVQKTFVSAVVSNDYDYKEVTSLILYPNPVVDHVNLVFELDTFENEGVVNISNQLGQQLINRRVNIQNGLNALQFPIDLPTGMYNLSLQVGQEVITKSLFVK